MRMSPRLWAKLALGVLIIGGTFWVLWAIYQPDPDPAVKAQPPPPVPKLHDTRAVVWVLQPGATSADRSEIACDGTRRTATGFWRVKPAEACDALASTRPALLAGRGCARTERARLRLHATGTFGTRRFDLRQQRGGCPDPDGWLAVNALVRPLRPPDQKLQDAESG